VPRLKHRNLVVVKQNLPQPQLRRPAIPAALARAVGGIRIRICEVFVVVVVVVVIIIVVLGVALGLFVRVAVAV
jgi:hypothetical protein